jgi:hypothetical protein
MRRLNWMCIAMLMGCGVNVETWDDFLTEYAHAKCLVYKQCYRAHYEGEYENYATCTEEVMAAHQLEKEEEFQNCNFSSDSGSKCLEEMNTSSCGAHWSDQASIFQACHEDIWACSVE